MRFFKMLVLVTALTSAFFCTGCSLGDFHAPRYGTPMTAGGGVGYSSTVIQTLMVVNKSEHEVLVEFPQFGSMNIEPLRMARKNLRVTERMDVAYSVTYLKDGRPIKVYSNYVCLEPIFDPYSGGRSSRSPTPKIEIPALLRDLLD